MKRFRPRSGSSPASVTRLFALLVTLFVAAAPPASGSCIIIYQPLSRVLSASDAVVLVRAIGVDRTFAAALAEAPDTAITTPPDGDLDVESAEPAAGPNPNDVVFVLEDRSSDVVTVDVLERWKGTTPDRIEVQIPELSWHLEGRRKKRLRAGPAAERDDLFVLFLRPGASHANELQDRRTVPLSDETMTRLRTLWLPADDATQLLAIEKDDSARVRAELREAAEWTEANPPTARDWKSWALRLARERSTREIGLRELGFLRSGFSTARCRASDEAATDIEEPDCGATLTATEKEILIGGFVASPSADRSFGRLLQELKDFPSFRFDAALMGAVDALVEQEEDDPFWLVEVAKAALHRLGGPPLPEALTDPEPERIQEAVSVSAFRSAWAEIRPHLPFERKTRPPKSAAR